MNEEMESGFIVIRPWMVDLKLSSNELIIFAVVNGFSMDKVSSFRGGLAYLCKVTGIARRTAINCLNSLVERGLLKKSNLFDHEKNVVFSSYSVDFNQCKKCTSENSALVKNFPRGSENSALGVVKNLHGGSENSAPKKEIGKKEKENREVKSRRATRLPADWQPTKDDVDYCVRRRPDLSVEDVVERFRNYWLAKSGRDATKLDWHATWRNWVLNEREQQKPKQTTDLLDYLRNDYRNTIDITEEKTCLTL